MKHNMPSFLSVLGGGYFLAMWGVYLFALQPDCFTSTDAIIDGLIFTLSPDKSGSWILALTLVSVMLCFICGALFFYLDDWVFPIVATVMHGLITAYFYSWPLVMIIVLPFFFVRRRYIAPST